MKRFLITLCALAAGCGWGAPNTDETGRLLHNLAGGLPEAARVTYYYAAGKKWSAMDSISVTRGMLDNARPASPWRVRQGGYSVFNSPAQCADSGAPLPFRRVRNKEVGDIFRTGYSDHFPVRVELEARPAEPEPRGPDGKGRPE